MHLFRRVPTHRIARILFLVTLLACLGGWVDTAGTRAEIGYSYVDASGKNWWIALESCHGLIEVDWFCEYKDPLENLTWPSPGWHSEYVAVPEIEFWPRGSFDYRHRWGMDLKWGDDSRHARVPYWLLLAIGLIAGTVLRLVRKHRAAGMPAFPVIQMNSKSQATQRTA